MWVVLNSCDAQIYRWIFAGFINTRQVILTGSYNKQPSPISCTFNSRYSGCLTRTFQQNICQVWIEINIWSFASSREMMACNFFVMSSTSGFTENGTNCHFLNGKPYSLSWKWFLMRIWLGLMWKGDIILLGLGWENFVSKNPFFISYSQSQPEFWRM